MFETMVAWQIEILLVLDSLNWTLESTFGEIFTKRGSASAQLLS